MDTSSSRRRLLALTALLTACGAEPVDVAADRAHVAALVPQDAVAVACLASLDELERRLREVAVPFGADPRAVELSPLLALLGPRIGATSFLDRRRTLAVALSVAPGRQPSVVALLPSRDPAGYAASLPAGTVVAGQYVAVPLTGSYARPAAPSSLAADMPAAAVVLRADLRRLLAVYGGMLQMAVAALERAPDQLASRLPGIDPEPFAEFYAAAMRGLLGSADRLQVTLAHARGGLEVSAELDVVPGSPMDGWPTGVSDAPPGHDRTRLAELAGRLGGDVFQMVMAGDSAALARRLESANTLLAAMYAPPFREHYERMTAAWWHLAAHLGRESAYQGGFDADGGLRAALFASCADAGQLATATDEMLAGEAWQSWIASIGGSLRSSEPEVPPGVTAREWSTRFDPERLRPLLAGPVRNEAGHASLAALLGSTDRLSFRLFGRGGVALLACNGPDDEALLERLAAPAAAVPAGLQWALDRLQDASPLMAMRMDLDALGRLAAPAPTPAPASARSAGAPEWILYGGIAGRRWRGGVRLDLGTRTVLNR